MTTDKGRKCEYCGKQTHMVKQGYATHIRLRHPDIWKAGNVLYPDLRAWEWPENLGQGEIQEKKVESKPIADRIVDDFQRARKFTQQNKNGNGEAPSFVIGADNILAIPVLGFYKSRISVADADRQEIDRIIDDILDWQVNNPTKVGVPFKEGEK